MDGVIRLDLGAGHKKFDGWVAVDFDVTRKKYTVGGGVQQEGGPISPHVAGDRQCRPFPGGYGDGLRAIHVIEHFQVWEVPAILDEWIRVLKPGGKIALECPCLDKIIKLFDVPNVPPYLTYWGLFGDPRLEDPLMMHHWCYTEKHLAGLMQEAGLVKVFGEAPKFHAPVRDMRIGGYKPAPEPKIVLPE